MRLLLIFLTVFSFSLSLYAQHNSLSLHLGLLNANNEFATDAQSGWQMGLSFTFDSQNWDESLGFTGSIQTFYGQLNQETSDEHLNSLTIAGAEALLGPRIWLITLQGGVGYASDIIGNKAYNLEGPYSPTGIYFPLKGMLSIPMSKTFSNSAVLLQFGWQGRLNPSGKIFDGFVHPEKVSTDLLKGFFFGVGIAFE